MRGRTERANWTDCVKNIVLVGLPRAKKDRQEHPTYCEKKEGRLNVFATSWVETAF